MIQVRFTRTVGRVPVPGKPKMNFGEGEIAVLDDKVASAYIGSGAATRVIPEKASKRKEKPEPEKATPEQAQAEAS